MRKRLSARRQRLLHSQALIECRRALDWFKRAGNHADPYRNMRARLKQLIRNPAVLPIEVPTKTRDISEFERIVWRNHVYATFDLLRFALDNEKPLEDIKRIAADIDSKFEAIKGPPQ